MSWSETYDFRWNKRFPPALNVFSELRGSQLLNVLPPHVRFLFLTVSYKANPVITTLLPLLFYSGNRCSNSKFHWKHFWRNSPVKPTENDAPWNCSLLVKPPQETSGWRCEINLIGLSLLLEISARQAPPHTPVPPTYYLPAAAANCIDYLCLTVQPVWPQFIGCQQRCCLSLSGKNMSHRLYVGSCIGVCMCACLCRSLCIYAVLQYVAENM